MKRLLICAALCLIAPDVSAYIDPGTGGMIVGGLGSTLWLMLGAAFAGILAFLARFHGFIKGMVLRIWNRAQR